MAVKEIPLVQDLCYPKLALQIHYDQLTQQSSLFTMLHQRTTSHLWSASVQVQECLMQQSLWKVRLDNHVKKDTRHTHFVQHQTCAISLGLGHVHVSFM